MKFKKEKLSGLEDTELHFTVDDRSGNPDPFKIIATKRGITWQGTLLIEDEVELDVAARAVTDAWVFHQKVRPHIILNS